MEGLDDLEDILAQPQPSARGKLPDPWAPEQEVLLLTDRPWSEIEKASLFSAPRQDKEAGAEVEPGFSAKGFQRGGSSLASLSQGLLLILAAGNATGFPACS